MRALLVSPSKSSGFSSFEGLNEAFPAHHREIQKAHPAAVAPPSKRQYKPCLVPEDTNRWSGKTGSVAKRTSKSPDLYVERAKLAIISKSLPRQAW